MTTRVDAEIVSEIFKPMKYWWGLLMTSSKNELQELFQREGLPCPTYETFFHGGTAHNPSWQSLVSLCDGQVFGGEKASTKSQAEKNAASRALSYYLSVKKRTGRVIMRGLEPPGLDLIGIEPILETIPTSSNSKPVDAPERRMMVVRTDRPKIDTSGSGAILVDLENAPTFLDKVVIPPNITLTVYGFTTEQRGSKTVLPHGGIKVMAPSCGRDAADILMQVYTGMLLTQELHDFYFVVTKDHFGSTLVELISSPGFGWNPKPARLITEPAQLHDNLS